MWEVPGSIPGVSSLFLTPKNFWQWWDSNPRPFRLVPKTSALDHSATLPTCYNLVNYHKCLFSSVVEHQSRKLGVVGSIPTGGKSVYEGKNFCRSWQGSNLRGQSPLDFKSNALTTRPQLQLEFWRPKKSWRCGGLNPGPFTCKANALPLSYIPSDGFILEKFCNSGTHSTLSKVHLVETLVITSVKISNFP